MTPHEDPPAQPGATKRQRIAKLMARAGLCSRRDAEAWIVDGRVSVNGAIITSPALDVSDEDAILIDGAPIPTVEKTRLFLFHKPRGLVTSDHDPEGRETVADFLREHWPEGPRVVTIGRLDINTEGLLLLTNDGGLARLLELPQTGWVRRYRVRAKGMTDPGTLDALARGVTIDGIDYAGIEAKLDRVQGANCWLTMGLREGKNREVKRVLEHIGLEVNRLIRLSFGPFQLLELPEGAVEEVRTRVLRDQLGENLAAAAGVDFGESEPVKPPEARKGDPRPRESDPRPREARKIEKNTHVPRSGDPRPRGARDDDARPRGARDDDARPPGRGTRPSPAGRTFRPPPTDRTTRAERREDRDDAPAPVRERPAAGTRKHVSTLRAVETDAARKGPRKRIERSDTQDRRERTIKVERLVSARAAPERPSRRPRVSPSEPRGDPNRRVSRDAAPKGRGSDERRGADRRPETRDANRPARRPEPEGRGRPAAIDRHREAPRREDRPRRDETRHASPSALGKRERMSRSGAAPERLRERPAAKRERPDGPRGEGRGPGAGGKVRSTRPAADSGRPAPRGERRNGPDKSEGRRPGGERASRPRPPGDRHEGRRDDKKPSRPAGRPMGAASRKPGPRKAPGAGGPPRGKPRGPKR